MSLLYNDVCREEESNIERLGESRRRYMGQVPGMNFLAGIIRLARRRTENGSAT
jgi:hypothetical protein